MHARATADPARTACRGKRLRRTARIVMRRRRQHAQRDQVLAAVVVDRDDLRRIARRALERDLAHVRSLVAAVAGAELRQRLRRSQRARAAPPGRAGRSREAARSACRWREAWRCGARRRCRIASVLRLATCIGARAPRSSSLMRIGCRATRLGEHGDADDADVERAAGARRVAVRMLGEEERRGARHALAPAGDLDASPRLEHIARLRGRRGVAGDDVDAVDARHRQHALAGPVADAHRVLVARRADDVVPAVLLVHRQRRAGGAIVDVDLRERCVRIGGAANARRRERTAAGRGAPATSAAATRSAARRESGDVGFIEVSGDRPRGSRGLVAGNGCARTDGVSAVDPSGCDDTGRPNGRAIISLRSAAATRPRPRWRQIADHGRRLEAAGARPRARVRARRRVRRRRQARQLLHDGRGHATSRTSATGAACACGCSRSRRPSPAPRCCTSAGLIDVSQDVLHRRRCPLAVAHRRRLPVRLRHDAGLRLRQQDADPRRRAAT